MLADDRVFVNTGISGISIFYMQGPVSVRALRDARVRKETNPWPLLKTVQYSKLTRFQRNIRICPQSFAGTNRKGFGRLCIT